MALKILKFGGTSVGDVEKIKSAALIVKQELENNSKVIVVVSAMAGATNKILSLCSDISSKNLLSSRYEIDSALSTGESLSASLFALALIELGINSRSYQAWQVKIKSNNNPNSGLIEDIDKEKILNALDNNIVPVITGFQAINETTERITTIGRGGSDTSAAAIAVAVGADYCDIYTDVEGMYSADPRLIHNAKIIKQISHEETLELAGAGAKVLHPRSVELCMRYGINLRIFSTFTQKSGTIIMSSVDETNKITAISYLKKMLLVEVPTTNFSFDKLVSLMIENGINIQQILESNDKVIRFTVLQEFSSKLHQTFAKEYNCKIIENISAAIIVGAAIRHNLKILKEVIELLNSNDIKYFDITNSEIKLSIFVNDNDIEKFVKVLHTRFIE